MQNNDEEQPEAESQQQQTPESRGLVPKTEFVVGEMISLANGVNYEVIQIDDGKDEVVISPLGSTSEFPVKKGVCFEKNETLPFTS